MLAAVFVVLAFLLHWVAELERGLLRGEENAGSEFILNQLRHAIRAQGQPVTRIGDAARLFFAPVEPFLINDPADHKRVGRIARVSLEPIWDWIRPRSDPRRGQGAEPGHQSSLARR